MSRHLARFLVVLILVALCAPSISTVWAQGDDDFAVTVEITGVIQSLSGTELVLVDGPTIKINRGTKQISPNLKVGMAVLVVAEVDESEFIAKSITAINADPPPVVPPSQDKGKGNQGKDKQNPGQDKNNGNQGKGQEKGGQDQGKDAQDCLANKSHPVATRLAVALGISYDEIMRRHCAGTGFGEISKAYVVARLARISVDQVFAMRAAKKGWGVIAKELGLKMKDINAAGKLKNPKKK